MDTLSHIMSFLVKLSKCSKIGYRAFSLDIITATLGTNWIWKPAAYFQEYCSSTINYFDPHFLLTTLMERCIDSAPTVRIRALSALCGLFETLSNTSPQAKCELLLNAALGTLVVEKSSKSTSPSSQKSKNIATIQKSLIEIFRECAMDDKPLVRSKSVQALGSALTLNWPKHISTEEARYKNFGSSLAPLSIANATSAKSSSNAASAPMEVEYVTMFVAEEDILVLGEKCNDSSLAVRKQAVSALSDLARSRTADSAILDAWVAAVLPMISDPESSVQVKVALSVQEILLDAVIAWARDVNRSYQGKKATSNSAGDNNDGEIYNPMDMSNIDTDCDGAWHILLRVSSTGQTRMLKANIAALVKQGVIAVSGVTVSTYGGSGGANNVPKLNMKDIIEAAKTACCFGIKPTSSSNQTTSETEMISKSGWILLEALVGQQYTFDDSTYLRNRKLDKTSVDFVVKCFAHKRQRSHQVLDEDDIRMLQVLEKLADNMVEEDILGMREELFPLLQAFSLSTDATSAGVTAMYALSRALAKHQNLAGSGQNPDATLTPGGNKKKSKGSKSQRDSRGGLAAADDMTDEQKEFWCNDVREWCGKLLSTAYIILDSFVQNKTIAAPSNQSNNGKKNSGSSSNTVISTVGLEGLPPAELTQAIVTAMNKIGMFVI